MRRWALAGGVVALAALVGVLAVGALLSNAGCAHLSAFRADEPTQPTPPSAPPVVLDEARVREEAPQLAALLDRAANEGRAEEPHPRTARAMHRYLQDVGAGSGVVEWRGVVLQTTFAVC